MICGNGSKMIPSLQGIKNAIFTYFFRRSETELAHIEKFVEKKTVEQRTAKSFFLTIYAIKTSILRLLKLTVYCVLFTISVVTVE